MSVGWPRLTLIDKISYLLDFKTRLLSQNQTASHLLTLIQLIIQKPSFILESGKGVGGGGWEMRGIRLWRNILCWGEKNKSHQPEKSVLNRNNNKYKLFVSGNRNTFVSTYGLIKVPVNDKILSLQPSVLKPYKSFVLNLTVKCPFLLIMILSLSTTVPFEMKGNDFFFLLAVYFLLLDTECKVRNVTQHDGKLPFGVGWRNFKIAKLWFCLL